jgi:hypothetical protein
MAEPGEALDAAPLRKRFERLKQPSTAQSARSSRHQGGRVGSPQLRPHRRFAFPFYDPINSTARFVAARIDSPGTGSGAIFTTVLTHAWPMVQSRRWPRPPPHRRRPSPSLSRS